jgi:hypothetical protein
MTFELWVLLNVVTIINSLCCWVWYVADPQSVVSTQQPCCARRKSFTPSVLSNQ